MKIENLRVAQVLKIGAQLGQPPVQPSGCGVFFLDSCQRYLWVFSESPEFPESYGAPLQSFFEDVPGLELFKGVDAYRFLLRVATGLESQILGETDIFGQLKAAWKNKKATALDVGVSFWLQKIFEDTKEVRARHLERVGGASYGSLVRKYFENQLGGVTLLVGAGALGASIAPYLLEGENLLVANRNIEKAQALADDLASPVVSVVSIDDSEAWARADRVIFCIPADATRDAQRFEWFHYNKLGGKSAGVRRVLHLGCMRAEGGVWTQVPGAAFLDDLFRLQKSLEDTRSLQLAAAERACDERAKLRGLGNSVSIAHGWEDLALFA